MKKNLTFQSKMFNSTKKYLKSIKKLNYKQKIHLLFSKIWNGALCGTLSFRIRERSAVL